MLLDFTSHCHYLDQLISGPGGEQPAVGRGAGGQNAVVVLEVQEVAN